MKRYVVVAVAACLVVIVAGIASEHSGPRGTPRALALQGLDTERLGVEQPSRPPSSPAVRVSLPLLVINADGSAAVTAYLRNVRDAEVSLAAVDVSSAAGSLAVESTQMWLPIAAGSEARVGHATDAGGFVVPTGVEAGVPYVVRFVFDDGTCVVADADAVRRDDRHRSLYPAHKTFPGAVPADPSIGFRGCGDRAGG